MNLKTVILIPAYNTHEYLPEVVSQIKRSEASCPVVIVDDGSVPSLDTIIEQKDGITILRHNRNYGKGKSIKTGIEYIMNNTDAGAVITMDGDGQHNAKHLSAFISAGAQNPKAVIIGKRNFSASVMPIPRIISNYLSSKMLSVKLHKPIKDSQCGFRLIPRFLWNTVFACREEGFQFESEFLVRAVHQGAIPLFIPIETIYNSSKSNINKLNDIKKFIKIYLNL